MILFIDDEPAFNDSYLEVLQDAGYSVVFESNINNAWEYLRLHKTEIQLIIVDIMFAIPDVVPKGFDIINANKGLRTGEELIRIINNDINYTKIPKIILTNVADEAFHSKFKNTEDVKGCYKKKEVSIFDLVDIVNKIIKKR